FIIDETYKTGMERINEKIKVVENTFKDDDALNKLLEDLNELHKCFGASKNISKASSIVKCMEIGGKVDNILNELNTYKNFMQHSQNQKSLKWQMDGNKYLKYSKICPNFTSNSERRKEAKLAVEEEYNPKLVDNLNKVTGIVEELVGYSTANAYENI